VLVADGALRAVAVPPGEHTIEMRYQSTALNVGLGITLFTAAALVAVAILQRAFSTRLSARSEC